jgi:hypothetical protein
MKRFSLLFVTGLLVAGFIAPQCSWAHGVSVGVMVGVPAAPVVYAAPAYYAPAYYGPAPVYGPTLVVAPGYGYYDHHHQWHPRHHKGWGRNGHGR